MSGKTPDALLKMPKLLWHQRYYLDIFQTLSEWRGHTEMGGHSPITLSNVREYCEMFGIDSMEMRATLLFHIKHLDTTFLTNLSKLKSAKDTKVDTPDT